MTCVVSGTRRKDVVQGNRYRHAGGRHVIKLPEPFAMTDKSKE